MESKDNLRIYSKFLHEILTQKTSEILDQIKSLKLSAISGNNFNHLAKIFMQNIYEKLSEWEIGIPTFNLLTSEENYLESFRYLLEIIQNENKLNLEKIHELKNRLKKPIKNVEVIFDCFEIIPELIEELENIIEQYNIYPDKRITSYKSLIELSTDLYLILNKLSVELNNFPDSMTSELNKTADELIVKLVKLSFVISDYPSRLIKKRTSKQTGTHFTATISCLIEQEKLFSSNPIIQIYFLNEDDLKEFIENHKLNSECKIKANEIKKIGNSWAIKNMTYDPPSKQKERKKADRITSVKSIILFRIKISANPYGLKRQFDISTDLFSDTVVSVVHTNQEIEASITLLWDEYFRIDRLSFKKFGNFHCHDSVLNNQLIPSVSDYFLKQTSRGLTLSNQEFLNRKLFSYIPNGVVSFYSFSRTHMPNSDLSFGQWICNIIKLIKLEGTIGMWKNDLIDGFVPKEVDDYFPNTKKGAFLLRFSERNPKIGVVVRTGMKFDAWSPFSIEECRCRSLPERLMDYQELIYLRKTDGNFLNKIECLSIFIDNKTPDDGYTQRGQLTKLLDGNMYMDDIDNLIEDIPMEDIGLIDDDNNFLDIVND